MNLSNSIRHVIWDWNGTLVDDVHLCVTVINQILERRSLPQMSVEDYRNTFDFPVVDYYRRIGFSFEQESFETLSAEFIDGYIKERRNLHMHIGAKEALEYFRKRGLPQCMLSATQLSALKQTLDEHRIGHYFKTVLGLDHHYADGKVHLGLQWLKDNHIPKDKVLFIGDTLHDLEVADEMGIRCLLVSAGHHAHDRLRTSQAKVVNNLNEAINLFEN